MKKKKTITHCPSEVLKKRKKIKGDQSRETDWEKEKNIERTGVRNSIVWSTDGQSEI